jgi:hypothetical protein
MPVLLRQSADMPEPSAYASWFAVTGAAGKGPRDKRLADLATVLEAAFDAVCPVWLELGRTLADAPGAELAYAPTCSAYASDLGLMMAWGRLAQDLARGPGTHLVICDDPWLFRHIAAGANVEAGAPPALWLKTLKLRLRGLLARLKLMGKLTWACLASRRQRSVHAPGDPVILVYGHPLSTADGFDAYFGPLMAELPALKRALHTDCPPARASMLAADGRTASLHAWGRPWWTPGLLFQRWRPRPRHLEGPYGWLVRRAAEREAGGGAHAINAWQRRCQDAWLAEARPSVVAWPWENHGWERGFCRAARGLGVATVGSQHTVIGPHQLNYSPATNIDGPASLPGRVACGGPAYRDQLAAWGLPAERLVIGGSLRIGPVEGNSYDPQGPVYVALSAKRSIAVHQVRAVEEAARHGHQFVIKDHPMYPLEFCESDTVRRTERAIGEHSSLSAVVYSTGASGLEALLAGLPTFRLLPEDDIAIDILPPFATARPVAAEDLARALTEAEKPQPLDWDQVLAPVDLDLWRRLLSGNGAAAPAADALARHRESFA